MKQITLVWRGEKEKAWSELLAVLREGDARKFYR
jgi:hypothetical protein